MKNQIKPRKRLDLYFKWPLFCVLFFAGLTIAVLFINTTAFFVCLGVTATYLIVAVSLTLVNRYRMVHELVEFAEEYSQIQGQFISELAIPYGILDGYGQMLWMNHELAELLGENVKETRQFLTEFPDISLDDLDFERENEIKLVYKDKNYRIEFKKLVPPEGGFRENKVLDFNVDRPYFVSVYFFDETRITSLEKEIEDTQMVMGIILLDNYDETMGGEDEVRRSLIVAMVDRAINEFFIPYDGVIRKMEKDRYFVTFKHKYLSQIQSSKFELLDKVKEVTLGSDKILTVSIGIGYGADTYNGNCDFARAALEMALGRGGDQAVVKEDEKIYYYGGKSKSVEKNTKVKARVKAHALREILISSERVIVMGHRLCDIDSFGAAVGVYRAAKTYDKNAYIVVDPDSSTVRQIYELFLEDEEYESGVFITKTEAAELLNDNTAVIVVDVNKPELVEYPELVERAKTVVVLDHHRQSSSVIENPVLSYVEPFASSACEMVAEILQYVATNVKLKKIEAEALYAGILIDTNYFSTNTGVRTFEAAAFLKRMGADVSKVRESFRDELSDFKAKANAIATADIFDENFVIAICDPEGLASPTVVAAQAANDLLCVNQVKASFVLTDYNDKIFISARSVGDVNVQLIMERIGGGGHMNTAGAQLQNCTINEAKRIIKETVAIMVKEGDI